MNRLDITKDVIIVVGITLVIILVMLMCSCNYLSTHPKQEKELEQVVETIITDAVETLL